MTHAMSNRLTALAAALSSACVLAAEGELVAPPRAPDGWVTMREDTWLTFAEYPADAFQMANGDFQRGEPKVAARRMRRCAAIVTVSLRRAHTDTKKALEASARELKKLARQLEAGARVKSKALEEAFARAEFALARHYHELALTYETQQDTVKMGHALHASAVHLLQASVWASQPLRVEDADALKQARSCAQTLKEGAAWAPKKVGAAVKAVGRGIASLGKKAKLEAPTDEPRREQ